MTSVLIADDDKDLLDLLGYALSREGYTLITALDGDQAVRRSKEDQPNLILLDVNLPRLNGFEVCRRIREHSSVPVIMLTARSAEEDIARGFQVGADDYVTKPFSPKLLSARMRAVLRRSAGNSYEQPVSNVQVGDLTLDTQTYQVTKGELVARLTPLEFRLLFMLMMNAGRIVPYYRLVEYVWHYDPDTDGHDSNLLKSHISHIRDKLGLRDDGESGIRSVVGVGYMLTES